MAESKAPRYKIARLPSFSPLQAVVRRQSGAHEAPREAALPAFEQPPDRLRPILRGHGLLGARLLCGERGSLLQRLYLAYARVGGAAHPHPQADDGRARRDDLPQSRQGGRHDRHLTRGQPHLQRPDGAHQPRDRRARQAPAPARRLHPHRGRLRRAAPLGRQCAEGQNARVCFARHGARRIPRPFRRGDRRDHPEGALCRRSCDQGRFQKQEERRIYGPCLLRLPRLRAFDLPRGGRTHHLPKMREDVALSARPHLRSGSLPQYARMVRLSDKLCELPRPSPTRGRATL